MTQKLRDLEDQVSPETGKLREKLIAALREEARPLRGPNSTIFGQFSTIFHYFSIFFDHFQRVLSLSEPVRSPKWVQRQEFCIARLEVLRQVQVQVGSMLFDT